MVSRFWQWAAARLANELRAPAAVKTRRFQAAELGRLTSSWTRTPQAIDAQVRRDGRTLTARTRDLALNASYAKKFLNMAKSNVIGRNGLRLVPKVPGAAGRLDQPANDAIKAEFSRWSRRGNCEITRRLRWVDVGNLFITGLLRDGEVLIRHREGVATPWRYAVQLLDVEQLDREYNEVLRGGNVVVMGVELNADRQPVAYHILDDRRHIDSADLYSGRERVRVPAREIEHIFIAEYVGQTRGISAMATAATGINMLEGFEDSVLVGARAGAAQMGFFTRDKEGEPYTGDGAGDDGELYMEAEPGVFRDLPAGVGVQTFTPDQPTAMYDAFMKRTLRGIAAGLNVSYTSLAADLEGVNLSSIRNGLFDERDAWAALQDFTADFLCQPVFERWIDTQLLTDTIRIGRNPLRITDAARYKTAQWHGRTWPWHDPTKDIAAAGEEMDRNVRSVSSLIRERYGREPREVFEEIAADRELLAELGLMAAPGAANTDSDSEEPAP